MYSINREEEFYRLSKIIENLMKNINIMKNDIKYTDNNIYKNKAYEFLENVNTQLEENLENLKELLEPFLLFIVGSGNYGKSTLINALVEEELVKTKDLPNTWKLDLFCKSNIEKIVITYSNKESIEMTLDEGIDYLNKEEEKFNKSRKKISKIFKDYKENNKLSVLDLKEYKKHLKEKYLYISNIVEVKYYLQKDGILKDFIIVDTPGLNQSLSKSILSSIEDYYKKSDGIIWIIDSQNIVSKMSNKLIKDIDRLNKIHTVKKNMILVVNKIDIIEKSSINNLIRVKEKVNEIYKDMFDDIVFISAKEAVKGRNTQNENLINKSNINTLRNSIDKYFKENSQINQIESKKKNLKLMADNIIKIMDTYKRELYEDISKYNKSKFELNERINNSKNYIKNLLIDIKDINSYKEININNLEKQLKEIEIICNRELNKLYRSFYSMSNFTNQIENKPLSINIYLTKNQNLIIDYSLIKSLHNLYKNKSLGKNLLNSMNLRILNNSKTLYHNELTIKNEIQNKINILIKESINEVNEKFSQLENMLVNTREDTFKIKYTEYENIKEHIKNLDVIYNTLKNLEVIL